MEKINLSDAEFKTLVIRMLRGITGYSKSINEEMNVTLREINIHRKPTVRECI